jgi:hypothetical protein
MELPRLRRGGPEGRLQRSDQHFVGGDDGTRTHDPLLTKRGMNRPGAYGPVHTRDAEVAIGHELGHLVHPAVPGSSLDGWRRGVLVLAAIGLLSLPLTLAWAPLLAVSVATEVVSAMFVVHWALVARLQRHYEFFADRYSAERLGGDRVADYLTGWVQTRHPVARGGRISLRINQIFATHPTIAQRVAAVRNVSVPTMTVSQRQLGEPAKRGD